jgi:hypothetical protein
MSPSFHVVTFPGSAWENGNFRLFFANSKWKQQTFVCLLQTERENEHLFSMVGKCKLK